jgi:hypothetical protein
MVTRDGQRRTFILRTTTSRRGCSVVQYTCLDYETRPVLTVSRTYLGLRDYVKMTQIVRSPLNSISTNDETHEYKRCFPVRLPAQGTLENAFRQTIFIISATVVTATFLYPTHHQTFKANTYLRS